MALTRNRPRSRLSGAREVVAYPAELGEQIFDGAYVCTNAAGRVVAGTDAAGLRPCGVAVEPMFSDDPDRDVGFAVNASDVVGSWNADGSGTAIVRVDTSGAYSFKVVGSPIAGANAYTVDDETVSAPATTHSIIGGHFLRPDSKRPGNWWVETRLRGVSISLSV